ncbi:MAG: flagellar hook protein [Lachnospiraceae bacterium]|jgi:flagellin|nr:flagellar hook protein [Lachnospiraceae bacterium]MDE6920693.1 flagellar hook protein [Lachnospiraceae bacterium]MDE6942722.1 flagellar hook protein [Lachnospiraceae bacterium]MDE6990727.1 flagellar hook protein [Lachnospiraceae bacterium]
MSYIARQNNRNLGRSFQKLASGKRINSAADDAAGLAIAQKLLKQTNGLSAGVYNARTSQNMINVAEGALGSVSDMLQRVNELSVQAANGTNSSSDRGAIQAEIDQLTQEIDRVSATTKFNETYLLKGGSGRSSVPVSARDAGIEGTLTQNATTATFTMDALKSGDKIKIGGTDYTIGDKEDETNPNLITADTAYSKIQEQLAAASSVGATTAATVSAAAVDPNDPSKVQFEISKGSVDRSESFSTSLQVGAESDMANKISVNIDALNAAGIGIKGLNVADKTGMAATNAIDAVADALSKISAQRSSLGAASNRLDHTIAYGNNAVYNLTASHSRIADTDYGKGVTELKKNQLLNTYSIMMQRKYMENQSGRVKQFFN